MPNTEKEKIARFYHTFFKTYKTIRFEKDYFYKNKLLIKPSPCFEQFVMHKLVNNGKPITNRLNENEIKLILNDYVKVLPDLPENIKNQFFDQGKDILQSFYSMEKDKIIQRLNHSWEECNRNSEIVSFLLEWIKKSELKEWMLKMIKICILGMIPDFNKRKKGEEFQNMVMNHFYSITLFFRP